jgi:hypothetical protein
LEMSSGSSLWRLYPKRSIASHSICGSGRLFRLFKEETRRAGSSMAELVVAGYTINSGRGQGYPAFVQMSREYCKIGKKDRTDYKICRI